MCAPTVRTIYLERIAQAWCVATDRDPIPSEWRDLNYSWGDEPWLTTQRLAVETLNRKARAYPAAEIRRCELSRTDDLAPYRPDRPADHAPRTQWLAFPCTRCGQIDPSGWITADDGHMICGTCEADCYVSCRHCHATKPLDADPSDHRPDDVCAACFADHSSDCAACGESFHDDDLESGLCESCKDSHWTCTGCDAVQSDDDEGYSTDDGEICESCYERHYFTCYSCDSVIRTSYYSHDGLCDSCATDCDCDSCSPSHGDSAIWRDDAVSALGFSGPKPEGGLWLGVELEVEVSGDIDDAAEEMADAFGHDFVIVKEDGSLSHGFEINTAPSGLDVHRARWEGARDSIPRNVKSWDTSTCGMHIHADRRALSEFGWGKVICLLCAPGNVPLFECIAGRSRHASYARANDGVRPTHGKRSKRGCFARYSWVNTVPSATVEFRLFKGTLDPIGYMKNVECIHAVVTYCRSAGLSQLTATAFLAWLDRPEQRKSYPALATFLAKKRHLRAIPPAPSPDEIERRRMESKARKLAARARLFVQAS